MAAKPRRLNPMNKTPRNFREIVLADLARAQRLISKIDDPGGIDPQFRIATPEGDFHIAMTLADDPGERLRQMRMVSRFMAWKMAAGFTLASELVSAGFRLLLRCHA